MRVRKTRLCVGFSWALEDVASSSDAHAQLCACLGEGTERMWAPLPLPAHGGGSGFAKNRSLQSSWQAKFRTWATSRNLGPGGWGLAALAALPTGPNQVPVPAAPSSVPGPLVPLQTQNKEGRREPPSLWVWELGALGVNSMGFFHTGHGTLGQSYVYLSFLTCETGDETSPRRQLWDEMRCKGSSTVLGTWWVGGGPWHEASEVKS